MNLDEYQKRFSSFIRMKTKNTIDLSQNVLNMMILSLSSGQEKFEEKTIEAGKWPLLTLTLASVSLIRFRAEFFFPAILALSTMFLFLFLDGFRYISREITHILMIIGLMFWQISWLSFLSVFLNYIQVSVELNTQEFILSIMTIEQFIYILLFAILVIIVPLLSITPIYILSLSANAKEQDKKKRALIWIIISLPFILLLFSSFIIYIQTYENMTNWISEYSL